MDFSSVSLPFGVSDMLHTTVEFLRTYDMWIVFIIAVIFAVSLPRPILNFIDWAAKKIGATARNV